MWDKVVLWLTANKETITLWIAIAGFAISLGQLVHNVWAKRERYRVEIIDYAKRSGYVVQFLVLIENKSITPLTISEISFLGLPCELERKAIRGNVDDWNFQHTADFPLCIQPHSATYCYLEFLDISRQAYPRIQLNRGTTVTLEIRSTRKLERRKLRLGNTSHYLHTKDQQKSAVETMIR